MKIPGRKTLLYSTRLVRSKFVKHGLILGYHRVNKLSWDPFRLAVSPESFSQQLEILHEHANVISLHDLAEARVSGDIPPRSIAITFDDGYADYLSVAKPLLDKAGFPSTIFISTGYIGHEFWWDILSGLACSLDPEKSLTLDAGRSKFEWHPDSNRAKPSQSALINDLASFLMPLNKDERSGYLQQLAESFGTLTSELRQNPALSRQEVEQLAADDKVTIGSHTVSHPMLSLLPARLQHDEIVKSKQMLETLTGNTVSGFSFPHGSKSDTSVRLVEECGYSYACASHNDVVWRNSDPFCLPRIWAPDCSGDTFLKLMHRWL